MGEAGNGLEALQRAREFQPNVVLLDLNMPRLGGLDVLLSGDKPVWKQRS